MKVQSNSKEKNVRLPATEYYERQNLDVIAKFELKTNSDEQDGGHFH